MINIEFSSEKNYAKHTILYYVMPVDGRYLCGHLKTDPGHALRETDTKP